MPVPGLLAARLAFHPRDAQVLRTKLTLASSDRFAGPGYRSDHSAPFECGRACLRHRRDLEVMSVIAQELGYPGAEYALGTFGEFGDHLSGPGVPP